MWRRSWNLKSSSFAAVTAASQAERKLFQFFEPKTKAGLVETQRRWGKSSVYRLVSVTRENWKQILRRLEVMDPEGTAARKAREKVLLQSRTAVRN